jgi:hypothetical protein
VEEVRTLVYARLVFVLLLATITLVSFPDNSVAQEGWVVKTGGAGSLDIMLEQQWTSGGMGRFNITFFHPNTTRLHEHQDYDVLIRQGDRQIFSAAAQINQQLLHNVPGTVTIPLEPFKFPENGDYTIEVHVLGLGFPPIPINPETATFPITVVPEFPIGMIGIVAALIAGSMVMTRKFRLL